ncbi:MAG: hypothetical protein IJB70_01310 [Clostridia bacterium]|nr:hypothetical protein [Clostridia bacterium]
MSIIPYKDNISSLRHISHKITKPCYFGYYDLKAYDDDDRYHLCNIIDFENRLQTADDVMELGVIEIETGNYEKIDTTKAWSFQQAAMLQWSGAEKDVVFYNVFENGEYMTAKKNIRTGSKSYSPICASIAQNGKVGVGINFPRIYDYRPGYGYSCTKDKNFDVLQPKDDGVFLVDIEKGTQKLLLSYEEMVAKTGARGLENQKFVVNHITMSPNGDKFMMLLRNFAGLGGQLGTFLIVSDLEGNMKCLTPMVVYSHYHWKNNSELLGYCEVFGIRGMWTVNVDTGEWSLLPKEDWPGKDIHCLYSPDRRFFIGDNYPEDDGYRTIKIYDTKTNTTDIVVNSYSPWSLYGNTDLRCDLHNRWNTKGNKISFDTVQNGKREIWEVDFEEYFEKKYK